MTDLRTIYTDDPLTDLLTKGHYHESKCLRFSTTSWSAWHPCQHRQDTFSGSSASFVEQYAAMIPARTCYAMSWFFSRYGNTDDFNLVQEMKEHPNKGSLFCDWASLIRLQNALMGRCSQMNGMNLKFHLNLQRLPKTKFFAYTETKSICFIDKNLARCCKNTSEC